MASTSTPRGHELTGGPRALRSGPAWLARLIGGRADALLDRIDLGLDQGSIEVTLPDGTRRLLGGRAPGFAAQARLNSWRALLRVAPAGSVAVVAREIEALAVVVTPEVAVVEIRVMVATAEVRI